MRGRIRSVSGHVRTPLATDWEFCSVPPDSIEDPSYLPASSATWIKATVPCTVASALKASDLWSLDASARRFDDSDWWFRTEFSASADSTRHQYWLGFDGLATVADVWLNGQRLLTCKNMFASSEVQVDGLLQSVNQLAIRFRSLDALLKHRRRRPRWRSPMVENQQLRWFRTTLLGRTPGWSPPAAPVGPWREVWIEQRNGISVEHIRVHAGLRGSAGVIDITCVIKPLGSNGLLSATLVLKRKDREIRAALLSDGETEVLAGQALVLDPDLWWPHTHGEPAIYDAWIDVSMFGEPSGAYRIDLGPIGFRSLVIDTKDGDFAVRVNDVPVFCRGACWTPPDPVSLNPSKELVTAVIEQACRAGMNMLRVCGPMVYEGADFLDLCDSNGILVWQDMMFANMDYPGDDAEFVDSIRMECQQILSGLQGRPSIAVLCGNSEVEQQAAMSGAPRDCWSPRLFHQTIRDLAAEYLADVLYWPSSAHGGAFPHQGNAGSTSYYGVGAYLRPLEDARRAGLRFASECLGFANIPEPSGLDAMPGGQALRVHHPNWKARSPRDLGAGWDFDDVRDHYLERIYGLDPLALRYADHDRYLELGRAATGEAMAAAFGEWRRLRSTTRGALVWFLRDLWPGAGWGLVDANGTPKAAYHFVRRAAQPVGLFLSDEGGNGLFADIVNDQPKLLDATLEVVLYRLGQVVVARAAREIRVPGHGAKELAVAELFDGFFDLTYAYRFGRPSHDLVAARLRFGDGGVLARATYFPCGRPVNREIDLGIVAEGKRLASGVVELTLQTRRFASTVSINASGRDPSDNYFHLVPDDPQVILLRPRPGAAAPTGTLQAMNAESPVRISLDP